MKDNVVIKSNAYGLILYLSPDVPFEEIRRDTAIKFSRAARFFRNAEMALTFRGRSLSEEEELALVGAITENTTLHIVCLVDEDKEHAQKYKDAMIRAIAQEKSGAAVLHRGTVRKGETVEADKPLVILGDVDPGARVISSGSVIIEGCCMGTVTAGAGGDPEAFVCALTLLPARLRIASVEAVSAITKRENTGEYSVNPRIAFLKDGHLKMEKLDGNSFAKIWRKSEAKEPAAGDTEESPGELKAADEAEKSPEEPKAGESPEEPMAADEAGESSEEPKAGHPGDVPEWSLLDSLEEKRQAGDEKVPQGGSESDSVPADGNGEE